MACNCTQLEAGQGSGTNDFRQQADTPPDSPNPVAGPCGSCKSCKKIQAGNHPDIIQIKPGGQIISIAQVRDLCSTIAMKPYEAKTRIAILHDAQCLNPAAGNALLKILEEPPERTVLVLIANQTQDLLPTIVSRCQQLRFNPISREYLEKLLIDEHGLEADEAHAIATMAGGSLSRAITMHGENWMIRRNWVLEEMQELSSRSIGHLMALAERFSAEKEKIPELLEIIKAWLRDLVMAQFYPDKILNQELRQAIQKTSQDTKIDSLLSKIDLVQSTQNRLQANPNVRLLMEVMLMELARS